MPRVSISNLVTVLTARVGRLITCAAILITIVAWGYSLWVLKVIKFGEAGELPGIVGKAIDPHYVKGSDAAKLSFLSPKTNELMLVIDWLSTNQTPPLSLGNPELKTALLANNALSTEQALTNVINHLQQMINTSSFDRANLQGLVLRRGTKNLFDNPKKQQHFNFLLLEDAARAYLKHEKPEGLDPAPIAVFVVACVVFTLLVIRLFSIYRERRALADFKKFEHTDWSTARTKYANQRPAYRIELFNKHQNLNDARECVPEISGLEAAAIHGQYSPIKIGIWILPVLGFVGTALGMSSAIGGFSSALGGDASAMTFSLSQTVIPGLASAFYTTIIALLAAVVAHFCATSLQDCELHQVDELDRLCLEKFAAVPRPVGGGGDGRETDPGGLKAREFVGRLKQVEDELADIRHRMGKIR